MYSNRLTKTKIKEIGFSSPVKKEAMITKTAHYYQQPIHFQR